MALQINIDNGGTLTDVCIMADDVVKKTKVLTTPYDLSKCFFEGLTKASGVLYGAPDVKRLLEEVDLIRYSTTQGTNAICERKGPRLGLILDAAARDLPSRLAAHDAEVFEALVGDRIVFLDADTVNGAAAEVEVVKAINTLTAAGANRLVVSFDGSDFLALEDRFRLIALRKYPRHLLGAVPILYGSDLTNDADGERRTWTALINSFLHPSMEGFLFNAENRLRAYRTKNPLLIFRNDGDASRVAKTIAIKTYSSGPRGGMEGMKAFSRRYGFTDAVSIDVGGTTTDIGQYKNGTVAEVRRGHVEGISVSFPLCEILSAGAGGSSIFKVVEGRIVIGPESVGAVPGPACFGRGGREATITDASLLGGLLDPTSYFGGGMGLDVDRAAAAVTANIATPLGVSLDDALLRMEFAYEEKIAAELHRFTHISPQTVMLAFGGAGPLNACGVADKAGIRRVAIPQMAAVFSAYGIGACDISQRYQVTIEDPASLAETLAGLKVKAARDMFAEGCAAGTYTVEARLVADFGDGRTETFALAEPPVVPATFAAARTVELELKAIKSLRSASEKAAAFAPKAPAPAHGKRNVLIREHGRIDVPVYRLADLTEGHFAAGPAVLEEDYFTCRVPEGWQFVISDAGDILLSRED
ncbi:hydantoinase/oxoprolinase family protein [Xanthobacter agilis]|jgi:N-methylhydantoinase A|uniref:N-methylhydantoinase A/oxoprolinase/acetone carboxylase beta subunit n=1 Tax=Xanthobacter agilis TaxID=47492 RepID=A0ABU0LK63_XANAG|nr:hydantoinase/oxoprolinase family protein [Xanthobacter agilis]MDQ0507479.1 N-methylhydantoinase A/oxoprolinase/acetone carboxylase beta subunit [Xanthobacter agilis]